MAETFDLIVIGTGSGGSAPAYRCRAAGWRVAVVDELPYGGTCALRGCDPKKVLVGAAELADWHRRMQGRGGRGDAHISWPELMQIWSSTAGEARTEEHTSELPSPAKPLCRPPL